MEPVRTLADKSPVVSGDDKVMHPNPNLHRYLQLASVGYGNTPIDRHMGVDLHPVFRDNQPVDPILNLLAHAAHPVEGSPDGQAIASQLRYLADHGGQLSQEAGRRLGDDHTMVINPAGIPQLLNLKGNQ